MRTSFPGVRVIKHRSCRGIIHNPDEIHRAGWIIASPDHIIENGYIRIKNSIITEVAGVGSYSGLNRFFPVISRNRSTSNPELDPASCLDYRLVSDSASGADAYSGTDLCGVKSSVPAVGFDSKPSIVDHGDGVIMPGLVNAHLHLELSALKGKLPFSLGFRSWVRELLRQRENIEEKILLEKAEKALNDMIDSGSLFGAEISTLGITENIVKDSMFCGIWFKELLGSLNTIDFDNFFNYDGNMNVPLRKLSLSLAGHAPHTSSPFLLKKIKKSLVSRGLVFSIHCAESDDESEFINSAQGPWADFLKERNIEFSSWPLPAASPVNYLFKLGLLDPLTVLVHLLNLNEKDFKLIADSGAKPVLCPRSNMNLHAQLPDIPKFLRMGLQPALGTDSLASCDSLSVFDEMAFVSAHFPNIRPVDIIKMATINGAYALGLDKLAGTLEKGKIGNFLYIPVEAHTPDDLLEQIIASTL